jgi:hypothetical protein
MGTLPINYALLGGNGNTQNQRRRQKLRDKKPRSPWSETNSYNLPPTRPPSFSLPTTLMTTYRMSLIVARSISLDSTFKGVEVQESCF